MKKLILVAALAGLCGPAFAQLKGPTLPPPPASANPSATIGAAAVNGSAATFMRSDAAPALPATLPALSGANLTGIPCANLTTATAYCSAAIGQLPGTTTNDDASAGRVGEYPTPCVVAIGSALSQTTGTPQNLCTLSLTAGDWNVSCHVGFAPAAATTAQRFYTSLSTTSGTQDDTLGRSNATVYAAGTAVGTLGTPGYVHVDGIRFSFASTTSVYCIANANFAASTLTVFGTMFARRAR